MNTRNMAPEHVSRLQRHPHYTDAGFTTTLAPAHLRPLYFDILSPGDSVYFKTKAFARLQEVVTAFLGEIDIHIDYFFVPLQMMYTPFGQQFAQTNDLISDLFTEQKQYPELFPTVSVQQVLHNHVNTWERFVGDEQWGKTCARLLDDLDLNPLAVCDRYQFENSDPEAGDMPDVHVPFPYTKLPDIVPWALCAYQAIYQRYFRNDNLERLEVDSYNFDHAYSTGQIRSNDKFLYLRRVDRPNDYFTDVNVSPLFSAVNAFYNANDQYNDGDQGYNPDYAGPNLTKGASAQNLLNQVHQWLVGSQAYSNDGDNQSFVFGDATRAIDGGESYVEYAANNERSSVLGSVVDNVNSFNNAAAIRTLFAVDKFLRIYGRAGKTYDDQILAHFGYKVPHDVKHDITHINHNRFVLTTDPVYSSSSVEGGSMLGQVGGQGSASCETKGDKFTAPVHGVFMCVVHAVTKPRYYFTFNKLHLLYNRVDFPIPEFDKLGQQPLWAYESNPIFFDGRGSLLTSKRVGWQYRYQEFKRKYNRISLAYMPSIPENQVDGTIISMQDVGANSFNPWVLSREAYSFNDYFDDSDPLETPITDFRPLSYQFLKEIPNALDNVMLVKYPLRWDNLYFKNPWLMFQYDPIIFDFYCEAKKVSWMSATGEPDL